MTLLSEARERLHAKGFTFPTVPKEDRPLLPADMTELGDRDLMAIYSQFVNWANYLGYVLASAEIEEREADTNIEYHKAKLLVIGLEKGVLDKRVTVAAKQVLIHPDMVDAQTELDRSYSQRKLALSQYTLAERALQALSREITRRVNMEPHQRRDHRWGGP